jgi:teichoic acid transport system permease protein
VTSISDRGGAERYSDVEYVFEPHGSTQLPLREYVRDLWDRRRFVQALAQAELRGSRSNTVVGELWGVFDPLVQGAIYWFLFTIIRGSGRGDNLEYLTVVIAGVFFFNFTRIALNDGGRAIIKGKGLMLNSTFPRALLPLAAVYRGLLEFAPAIPVYLVFHLVLRAPIGPGLAMLPFLFLVQVAMSVGLALLMSTAVVLVRDTSNLLNYVMRILIFVTPVIYPVSSLTPTLTKILSLNPLFALFASYQAIIHGDVPSFGLVVQAVFWATLSLVLGVRTFRKHEHSFALYL